MTRARRKKTTRKSARKSANSPVLFWALVLAVVAVTAIYVWQRDPWGLWSGPIDPTSEPAFERWLDQDSERRKDYAALQDYLSGQGVGEVVPVWQLARVDREYAEKCKLEIWRLPPRELWPNVVPALRLVRDHVIPTMGEVAVQSSYRSPELNECARGAPNSRHISFEALDLFLVEPRDDLGEMYRELCDMQEAAGPESRMGLGAYYDPADEFYNPEGRFHIDGAGYRSWGRSYTKASSICPR